jgi:hypothetical protein
MDIVATALTAAWLDAVRRTQREVPLGAQQSGPAETLTDALESALRHGGLDSLDAGWTDPARPGRLVDISA